MITINNKPLLANALIFDHAYHILNKQMAAGTLTNSTADLALTVPVAVNCAFACELFFKSMLPDTIREHKLNKLFDSLDEISKNAIIDGTTKLMQQDIPSYSEQSFRSDLENNAEAFVTWRYFHENGINKSAPSFNSRFMYNLEEVLKSLTQFYDKSSKNDSAT